MPASARIAAAVTVAASLFGLAYPASAADLYGPGAYDEPRYGEIYDEAPPEDFEPPYPPRASFKDDYGPPPYERHSGRYDDCVPRHVARDRLYQEGWGDFSNFEPRGHVVLVQARRPSGRLFDLTIDRCSGEIVEARPIHGARYGSYKHGRYGAFAYHGPRRWSRSY